MENQNFQSECGCSKGSITSVSLAIKLLKKRGMKCIGCISDSIRERVLKKWKKVLKNREVGGLFI